VDWSKENVFWDMSLITPIHNSPKGIREGRIFKSF